MNSRPFDSTDEPDYPIGMGKGPLNELSSANGPESLYDTLKITTLSMLTISRWFPMNALQMVMLVGALVISTPSMAADPQLIEVKPDETADAYFQINVSGKVYVKIAAKPGEEACVDLWWIKWPFGTIEQLGRHCNFASFEIPGFTAFAISSKLRVGGAKNSVKLAVSATEQVAHSVTFTF